MAVDSFERAGVVNRGDSGGSDDIQREWIARGTAMTPTEVLDTAEFTTDLLIDGLERKNHTFKEISQSHFEVTAHYSNDQPKSQRESTGGDITFQFDDTVAVQNIKFALETVKSFDGLDVPSGKAPELHDAINVQGSPKNRTIEGTDSYFPESGFSYELTNDETFFDDAFRRRLGLYRAHVNHAPWKEYERGELLFMGTGGNVSNKGNSSISLRFAVRENLHIQEVTGNYTTGGLDVPGPYLIAGVDVTPGSGEGELIIEGWQEIDVYRQQSYDKVGNRIEDKPLVIRILRLYDYANFVDLGLGT